MPHIRGIRNYSFYNDEGVDHNISVDDIQAIRLSRVPAYNPATTLAPIVEALRDLARGHAPADGAVSETKQFVAEDSLLLSDITVAVEGVGELQLPLEEDTIERLVNASEGAKISCSPEELEVTDVRSPHVIPASGIRVELKEEALDRILKRISDSLNINETCSLKPNIRCLSIYGSGQFLGSQRDCKREGVRLEVVLPSQCEGGDIYIKHGTESHKCSSSGDADRVQWTAYYSDCPRWVFEVQRGHRVVLTYDVDLEYPSECEPLTADDCVDAALNDAVARHLSREDRLIVLLLHRYTAESLDWCRVKGRDVRYARALLAVAKSQDLRVFLASGRCLETWESSGYHGPVRNGGSVELRCWMDESGRRVERTSRVVDYEGMAREVCTFGDELWALGEPDEEVKLGWYGEGPAIRELWFHRACVVLLKK